MADNENKQPEEMPGDELEQTKPIGSDWPQDTKATAARINSISQEAERANGLIKRFAREIVSITSDATDLNTLRNQIVHVYPEKDLNGLLSRARKTVSDLLPTLLIFAKQLALERENLPEPLDKQTAEEIALLVDRLNKVRETYNLYIIACEAEGIENELTEELKRPKYKGKTLEELFNELEKNPRFDGTSLFEQLITDAKRAKYPTATITRPDYVEFPLDKPNSRIWNLLEKNTEGQVTFNLAKTGSKKELLATYSIDFDALEEQANGLKITKRLQIFDKRVYMAISALYNAGNIVVTLSQIYYAMGYTGRPGKTDLNKINQSITKMMAAHIFFDNEQEAQVYKSYPHFRYDASLLPAERGTYIVNGQMTDAAIRIFREPPLITFAKQRRQITTIEVKLLQSPISKTDMNLLIDDYLIERISRAKNGKSKSCRILFKTLYEHARIADKPKTSTEKQQKKRMPEKVQKYLEHYQSKGFIKRFSVEPDGVTVHW